MNRRNSLLLFLAISALATWYLTWANSVARRLSLQMQLGPGAMVDFTEIAPFQWNRIHFFGADATKASVEQTLDFPWADISKTNIETAAASVLVVFVREKRVVHWLEVGTIEPNPILLRREGFRPNEAKFEVVQEERSASAGLVWRPN